MNAKPTNPGPDIAGCRRFLLASLSQQMDRRQDYPDNWVERERCAIAAAARTWADWRGLSYARVTAADVERVEGLAVGHVDYASKLALYVAELTYGVREVRP